MGNKRLRSKGDQTPAQGRVKRVHSEDLLEEPEGDHTPPPKPFKCSVCWKEYVLEGALRTHLQAKHPGLGKQTAAEETSTSTSVDNDAEGEPELEAIEYEVKMEEPEPEALPDLDQEEVLSKLLIEVGEVVKVEVPTSPPDEDDQTSETSTSAGSPSVAGRLTQQEKKRTNGFQNGTEGLIPHANIHSSVETPVTVVPDDDDVEPLGGVSEPAPNNEEAPNNNAYLLLKRENDKLKQEIAFLKAQLEEKESNSKPRVSLDEELDGFDLQSAREDEKRNSDESLSTSKEPSGDGVVLLEEFGQAVGAINFDKKSNLFAIGDSGCFGKADDILTLRPHTTVSDNVADAVAFQLLRKGFEGRPDVDVGHLHRVLPSYAVSETSNNGAFRGNPSVLPGLPSLEEFQDRGHFYLISFSGSREHAWLTVINFASRTIKSYDSLANGIISKEARSLYNAALKHALHRKYQIDTSEWTEEECQSQRQGLNDCVVMSLKNMEALINEEEPMTFVNPRRGRSYRREFVRLLLSTTDIGKRLLEHFHTDMDMDGLMTALSSVVEEAAPSENGNGTTSTLKGHVNHWNGDMMDVEDAHVEPLLGEEFNGQNMDVEDLRDGFPSPFPLLEALNLKSKSDVTEVANKLMSFLNFEDMKALSMASKETLKAVRSNIKFLNRATLLLSKEVMKGDTGPIEMLSFPWTHLEIHVSNAGMFPLEDNRIGKILETAESLFICRKYAGKRMEKGPDVAKTDICDYLKELLGKTKSLKQLQIERELFSKTISPDFWKQPDVRETLRQLRSIQILDSWKYLEGPDQLPLMISHVRQLTTTPTELKSFFATSLYKNHLLQFFPNPNVMRSLEVLELDHSCHTDAQLDAFRPTRCPNLKSLSLSINDFHSSMETAYALLCQQPPLEELCISFQCISGLNFLGDVGSLISQDPGWIGKLRKLHLKAENFGNQTENPDWTFLRSMTQLKDLSLKFSDQRCPYPERRDRLSVPVEPDTLISHLPSQLEKLTLQQDYSEEFWPHYYRHQTDLELGPLLVRFSDLTELDIHSDIGTVTDDALQNIISHCPKLIRLSFTASCCDFTDYGVTGVDLKTKKKTGVSLDQLMGLVHLKIRACPYPKLTPGGLLSVTKFKFLRSFVYRSRSRFPDDPKEYIFQLARQNPCLEVIELDVGDSSAEEVKEAVKKINPRTRHIHLW